MSDLYTSWLYDGSNDDESTPEDYPSDTSTAVSAGSEIAYNERTIAGAVVRREPVDLPNFWEIKDE